MASDQIEEVKQKIDIVDIINERVPLKKAGRSYKANCPFHGEKTPSFVVTPELQIYKCFGCGASGDVYTFLQEFEGMEFREALEYLAKRAGVKLIKQNLGGFSEKEKLYNLNRMVANLYHYVLTKHKEGKNAYSYFLTERGIKQETLEKFELGYSINRPGLLLKLLTKKGYEAKDLTKAGLIYPKGNLWIDRFAGRVIFPLHDQRGNVVGFAGRVIPGTGKDEEAKYINTPETPVYHKSAVLYGLHLSRAEIKKEKYAIVVEGELDMISCFQSGIKNVVAIKGSALTEEQVRLLTRFCEKIVLCLDSDFAGDAASRRGIIIAENAGLVVKVAELANYKDPDEMARKNPDMLKKVILEAVNVWDFYIDSCIKRFDENSGEGKKKISKELIPILAMIPDMIVQAHYIKTLSKKLDVPEEAIREEIEKFLGKQKKEIVETKKDEEVKKDTRTLREEYLLKLAFRNPGLIDLKRLLKIFKTPIALRVLSLLENYLSTHQEFVLKDFFNTVPKETVDFLVRILVEDFEDDQKVDLEKDININLVELYKIALKEIGDKEGSEALYQEYRELLENQNRQLNNPS